MQVKLLILLITFVALWSFAFSENPAYKYSKEANAKPSQAANHHGHSHDHHGHSHDHHGHDHHGHDHHGHSHDHHGNAHKHPSAPATSGKAAKVKPPSKVVEEHGSWSAWIEALCATAIISVAPIFILFLVPLDNTEAHQPLLKILLSFASGGLLGDAFLHLIPHALDPHEPAGGAAKAEGGGHQHNHSHGEHDHSAHMHVGLWVVAGILAFLLVEKVIRYLKADGHHSHGPRHGHSDPKEEEEEKKESVRSPAPSASKDGSKDDKAASSSSEDKPSGEVRKRSKSPAAGDDDSSTSKATTSTPAEDALTTAAAASPAVEDIKVAGYLNLAADFAHNFTDGLAIGASFMLGRGIGAVTTVTIFFHEIPHEIGDYAILIQSGCSRRKAILLQLSTAIGALLGTLVSLLAGSSVLFSATTSWILPFTAGGFIYIATVSVIPELLEDSKPWQSFKEILALLVGVFMMVLIAKYE